MLKGSRGIGSISQALSSLYIYSSIGTYYRAAVAVVLGLAVPICGIGPAVEMLPTLSSGCL
jgi:hypothetical protein